MKRLELQAVVYQEANHVVAQCLNVDVSSFGNTEGEALTNLREALELYFEDNSTAQINDVGAAEVKHLTLQRA